MRPNRSSENTEEQKLEKRIQMAFQLNRHLRLLKRLKVIQWCNLRCCSVAKLCPTLRNPMDFPVLHHLLEFAQTHVHWVSDAIQASCPLSSHSPFFPSIRVFSNESVLLIRWSKYWSFSFSISPSNDYSGLISFWIDWFELLVVQGTLKSLLQHHNAKT